MKIRFATEQDIPYIVEMGRRYHAATRFQRFDYQPDKIGGALGRLVRNPRGSHCFFVAEHDSGSLIGGLIGCIEAHIFSDQPVASLIHYDVDRDKRMSSAGYRLLLAFRKWAENRGAVEINLGVTSGVDLARTDRFLRKLGFVMVGANYVFDLEGAGAPG